MSESEIHELRALFAAMSDGTLTPEQHGRLDKLLAASAEARRLWFLHCDIETGLADWAATQHAQTISRSSPWSQPPHRGSAWKWLPPLAAVAAFLLAALLWWPRTPEALPLAAESPANGVAVLARAVGVQWADGLERAPGSVLAPGTLKLTSGAALVEFYSGARVVVEGPAEFRLIASGEAYLHSGKINAHVPPQARGFTISSPEAKVVDHGTDFGLVVNNGTSAEVHVFTGKVEVSLAKSAPRPVSEGEAVRFDTTTFAPIPATRTAFLSEEELARRDTMDAAQRFAAWRESSRALSSDVGMVVHYVFDETDVAERRLASHRGADPSGSQASIVGCAWTTGRFPGKQALAFRSEGDRVRLTSPSMNTLTLLAWVRVDALPRWQNVLLATDSEQPGSLRWHLTQRGELRLEIARDLGRPHADWEAVNSAPFVTPDRLGQWLLLVTTFDGKTVRHYGNGQPIGSGPSFTPPALHISTAELGNWRGTTQRHLAAAMDEFAILSRVLSDEEVLAFYRAGK